MIGREATVDRIVNHQQMNIALSAALALAGTGNYQRLCRAAARAPNNRLSKLSVSRGVEVLCIQ